MALVTNSDPVIALPNSRFSRVFTGDGKMLRYNGRTVTHRWLPVCAVFDDADNCNLVHVNVKSATLFFLVLASSDNRTGYVYRVEKINGTWQASINFSTASSVMIGATDNYIIASRREVYDYDGNSITNIGTFATTINEYGRYDYTATLESNQYIIRTLPDLAEVNRFDYGTGFFWYYFRGKYFMSRRTGSTSPREPIYFFDIEGDNLFVFEIPENRSYYEYAVVGDEDKLYIASVETSISRSEIIRYTSGSITPETITPPEFSNQDGAFSLEGSNEKSFYMPNGNLFFGNRFYVPDETTNSGWAFRAGVTGFENFNYRYWSPDSRSLMIQAAVTAISRNRPLYICESIDNIHDDILED